jgi:hypothetical protein
MNNLKISRTNPLTELPEMALEVFSKCGIKAIGRCACCCKNWLQVIKSDALWQQIFPHIEKIAAIDKFYEFVKDHKFTMLIDGIDTLIKSIEIFLESIDQRKAGRFVCRFPLNGNGSLELTPYIKSINSDFDVDEECIFTTPLNPSIECPKFEFEHFHCTAPLSESVLGNIMQKALNSIFHRFQACTASLRDEVTLLKMNKLQNP